MIDFRTLIDRLHMGKNPLGSCLFADEFRFRTARIEIVEMSADGTELRFKDVLRVLALHVTGPKSLPFDLQMDREEALARYAQMAVISHATSLYGQHRSSPVWSYA